MKRTPRRVLSLLLSLAMLVGLCIPTAFAAEGKYQDTQGHWAEAAIERWSAYGVIQGSGGNFQPDASLTRAQMATILANTLGLTETGSNPFSDVPDGAWYAPYILRCHAAGMMQGSGGKASPDSTITRQEAMVMLARALNIQPLDEPFQSSYADHEQVADWAAPYVGALIDWGFVGGVTNELLAPGGNMSRASMVTMLDRAVIQYIHQPGTYTLKNTGGIILVVAGDVTLTGKTDSNILVTPAASGKALAFDKATVTGSITVQADNAKITSKDSSLPELIITGKGTAMEPAKPVSGGSSGSSGGSGGGNPGPSSLTIAEAKTVTGGTYQDVTITAAVADGSVTLDGVTIQGSLTVQGGGSHSINLTGCTVSGKVVLDKEGGEAPRLHLTNTPISQVEANKPAILEADDAASAITAVTAKANVEVKGSSTAISSITVPTAVSAPVAVTVTAGTVAKVEAKSETTVSGAAGSITAVVAEAPVTVASEAVNKVEVPATAGAGVTVAVTGTTALEVEVNSTNGAAITAEGGATIDVSTTLETPPVNVTVGGTPVAHMHKWDAGVVTQEATCAQDGLKIYTCTAAGCADPADTKTEETPRLPHTVVEDPVVAANCTTPGKTAGSHCSVCNAVIVAQKDIPAKGHKEVVNPAVAATCTTPGKTEGKHCSVCNAVITAQEVVPALGHTEVIDPAVAATCTTPGKTEGKHCSVCNAVITAQETISALGHDFTGAYQNDASGHWHTCSRCDEIDAKAAHTYNTADCAQTATCTVCTYEKAAGAHTWGDWTKVDDTNHKHICSSCKTEETAAHTWDAGVVTTEPTESTEGVMTFTCTACEATKTENIPAIGEELNVAVPANLKLAAAKFGIALTMTAPATAEREKIANGSIQYTLYVDGVKGTTRNISAVVVSTAFMTSYRNLSTGTAQIRYEITSQPTEAAKAEGYVAGSTSFDATITLTEEMPLAETSAISATITADGTLTLTGLMPNQIYEIDAYEKDAGGPHLFKVFQADGTGTYTEANQPLAYNEMKLCELSFSEVTNNSATLVRRTYNTLFPLVAQTKIELTQDESGAISVT